jgi:hypothetical protein
MMGKKLHDKRHVVYCPSGDKIKRVSRVRHAARIRKVTNVKTFNGKILGNKQFWISRCKRENNIIMNLDKCVNTWAVFIWLFTWASGGRL